MDTTRARWLFDYESWRPTDEEWTRALSLIEKEEQERILRFKRPSGGKLLVGKDNPNAKASLIGRLMLRKCAMKALNLVSSQISFARTKEGKPYLIGYPQPPYNFNINISHGGRFVALGSEPTFLIGVDIMPCSLPSAHDTVSKFFDIMQNCFTTKEWEIIRSRSTEQEQIDAFFTFWCLKESYIKAVGIGLGFDLQRAEFTLDDPTNPRSATISIDGQSRRDWKFEIHRHFDHIVGIAYGPAKDAIPSFRETIAGLEHVSDLVPNEDVIRIEFRVIELSELLD